MWSGIIFPHELDEDEEKGLKGVPGSADNPGVSSTHHHHQSHRRRLGSEICDYCKSLDPSVGSNLTNCSAAAPLILSQRVIFSKPTNPFIEKHFLACCDP